MAQDESLSKALPLEGGKLGGCREAVLSSEQNPAREPTHRARSSARRMRKDPTIAERMIWKALRRSELHFRRQVPIDKYVVDFAHLGSRLLIEVDGRVHEDPSNQQRDLERQTELEARGYRFVRCSEREAREYPDVVVERILAAVAEFTPIPGPSPSREGGEQIGSSLPLRGGGIEGGGPLSQDDRNFANTSIRGSFFANEGREL
jgi:very-short-patch-repair endonuclease